MQGPLVQLAVDLVALRDFKVEITLQAGDRGGNEVGALPRGRWQVVRVHSRVGVHWQASCAFRRQRQPRLALSWKVSVVELELRRGEGLLGVVAGQACRKAEA